MLNIALKSKYEIAVKVWEHAQQQNIEAYFV